MTDVQAALATLRREITPAVNRVSAPSAALAALDTVEQALRDKDATTYARSASNEVCACLLETGGRQVEIVERCVRCGLCMDSDALTVAKDAVARLTAELEAVKQSYDEQCDESTEAWLRFSAAEVEVARLRDALQMLEDTPGYCEDDTQAVVSMLEIARAALGEEQR